MTRQRQTIIDRKGGEVLHVVLIGPQHIADMHLADTLVFIVPVFTSNWKINGLNLYLLSRVSS